MEREREIVIRAAVPSNSDDICRLNEEELGYPCPREKTWEKLVRLLESASDRISCSPIRAGCNIIGV